MMTSHLLSETEAHSSNLQPAASMAAAGHRPSPADVLAVVRKRSFATLSTASAAGRPHVAGVLYEMVGTTLWVNTLRTSRKALNVAAEPRVALVIPIRRLPVGPPSTVMFQARAELVDTDAPEVGQLLDAGHLGSITSHGELELESSCFLRITPPRRWVTYGLGMSLWRFVRDPLGAGGHVEIDGAA